MKQYREDLKGPDLVQTRTLIDGWKALESVQDWRDDFADDHVRTGSTLSHVVIASWVEAIRLDFLELSSSLSVIPRETSTADEEAKVIDLPQCSCLFAREEVV